ncbi:hypothetical protein F2981_22210 (plasmid) [Sinorhizobium meliloti]|nr:hypothetical protein [Sinorhizobium meliloti]
MPWTILGLARQDTGKRLERTGRPRLPSRRQVSIRISRVFRPISTSSATSRADTATWSGYLDAHRSRRAYFKNFGATSTDHGHATADTANLSQAEAAALFDRVRLGKADCRRAALVPAQMLTEMAKMSLGPMGS